MVYPENFESKIGFDIIRNQCRELCTMRRSVELLDCETFSTSARQIATRQALAAEMGTLLTMNCGVLKDEFYDIDTLVETVRVQGTFLDCEQVMRLGITLSAAAAVVDIIRDSEQFKALNRLSVGIAPLSHIIKEIDRIIDERGNMRDSASPELAAVRREIRQSEGQVSKRLQAVLQSAKSAGIVDADAAISIREGRAVIPVAAANKRKLQGFIHDESATGKTFYVEPVEVVELNNRLKELEYTERREIVKVLTAFADILRDDIEAVARAGEYVATIDMIRAKARWAAENDAVQPIVSDGELWLVKARHPLLAQTLKRNGRELVPLDARLDSKNRILVISGPNAGGKSVCLKTVAMLQYMMQCGLPVPMHEASRMGFFKQLLIDIGDEQSIEDDLSTYSSHLRNMKYFVRHADAKTLLLIDEFGTGTEPMIGGAIAEAVLSQLNEQQAFGVVTTHYGNLKHLAERTEGIINGAMLYDRGQLKPLFQLSIGQAGSSFAVEIARQIGLPETIIQRATDIVGEEHIDYDKHLQDIARDKRYWENKRQNIRQKEKHLEEKIAHYEEQMAGIKAKKRAILEEANAEAANLLRKSNATIERTIREIKEAKAEKNATQAARQKVETLKTKVESQASKTSTTSPTSPTSKTSTTTQSTKQPKILRDLSDLKVLTKNPAKLIQEQGNKSQEQRRISNVADELRRRKLSFSRELDIRGMRVDEALEALIAYVDDALMVNAEQVSILHGTGTGALKQVVRDYLAERQKSMRRLKSGEITFHDGDPDRGGAGITVVEL